MYNRQWNEKKRGNRRKIGEEKKRTRKNVFTFIVAVDGTPVAF